VAAYFLLAVSSGDEGALAGGALGQAGDAHYGVNVPQNKIRAVPERSAAELPVRAEEFVEPGGGAGKGVEGGIIPSNAEPVEEDEEQRRGGFDGTFLIHARFLPRPGLREW
jgi:hypothetical protein